MAENIQPPEMIGTPGGVRRKAGRPRSAAKASAEQRFNESRARKETALADLRELELATKRAELVEASAVEAEWRSLLGAVRSGMLAVASRVAPELVTLSDERAIEDAIQAAIHEAMEAIAHD